MILQWHESPVGQLHLLLVPYKQTNKQTNKKKKKQRGVMGHYGMWPRCKLPKATLVIHAMFCDSSWCWRWLCSEHVHYTLVHLTIETTTKQTKNNKYTGFRFAYRAHISCISIKCVAKRGGNLGLDLFDGRLSPRHTCAKLTGIKENQPECKYYEIRSTFWRKLQNVANL